MNKVAKWIKKWFFPATDKKIIKEIYTLNIKNIHYVTLVVGVIQLISLAFYFGLNFNSLGESKVAGAIIRVGLSVLLCLVGYIISGVMMKNPDTIESHAMAVRLFIGSFIILLIIWAMFVSVNDYITGQQLLTFYTVELLVALFVRLKPIFTTSIILGSYIIDYLILTINFGSGKIIIYNYLMLAVLSVAGSMLNYQLTVKYIAQKNKANELNTSLEIIANHDSLTRLLNRYALNQRIPEFIGKDICIAMGDVDHFKMINDTYGHNIGDEVLEAFSKILLEIFDKESVFRYGGDEFLVIEKGVGPDEFREKLNEAKRRFGMLRIAEIKHELGCCFGSVKAHPDSITDFFDMLTKADKELYHEKDRANAGR